MTILSAIGKIHILPGEVVSRIAAGEVIERPAAVVKELIDNSIDAGSARIMVEVTDGGRDMIRVTDDGEGMSRADAPMAFQRHATSKLRTEGDLFSIETMGFRGEALPSIASVSHVRVRTASRTDSVGTQLFLTGGLLTRQEDTAGAPGTQVEVTQLFFNTPARKKFLKTTATEFSHICQVVQRSAIAWPSVQFSLKHNNQEVLDYPLVESRRDRILQIYGARVVGQMTAVRSERPGIRIEGMTVKAVHTRATRSPQELFVNRRPVRNTTVTHAVYDGYGASLAKGCHPVYVLCLEIDPMRVDVNVHPAKREVRFADQDLIHQTIRQAIREAAGAEHPVVAPAQPDTDRVIAEQRHSTRAMVHGWREAQEPHPLSSQIFTTTAEESSGPRSLLTSEAPHAYLAGPPCDVIPFGQVNQTFLVAQVGHELQVIDQHTAHERVLFERLWRAWVSQSVPTQTLLIPESIEGPPHAASLIHEHLSDLAKLGLDIEPFGGKSLVIRAVPALLGHLDYCGLVQDLADDLTQWNSTTSLETKIRPVLASLACHAAIRAGRPMAQPEMKQLIDDWLQEGQPATCPHGRRIALRFSTDELAKIFGR